VDLEVLNLYTIQYNYTGFAIFKSAEAYFSIMIVFRVFQYLKHWAS